MSLLNNCKERKPIERCDYHKKALIPTCFNNIIRVKEYLFVVHVSVFREEINGIVIVSNNWREQKVGTVVRQIKKSPHPLRRDVSLTVGWVHPRRWLKFGKAPGTTPSLHRLQDNFIFPSTPLSTTKPACCSHYNKLAAIYLV